MELPVHPAENMTAMLIAMYPRNPIKHRYRGKGLYCIIVYLILHSTEYHVAEHGRRKYEACQELVKLFDNLIEAVVYLLKREKIMDKSTIEKLETMGACSD